MGWAAFGKHPVSKDFVALGKAGGVAERILAWVEGGYERYLREAAGALHAPCSWRFVCRGDAFGGIVWGLVRDSCDSVGRTFPLAVVIPGRAARWDSNWVETALGLEGSWSRVEFACSRTYSALPEMEEALDAACGWDGPPPAEAHPRAGQAGARSPVVHTGGMYTVRLGCGAGDREELVHALEDIRRSASRPPEAVFMGGSYDAAEVAAFERGLVERDFVRLWNVCAGGKVCAGAP
ncbi:MAG TPA: type VI secretion system-associated protein TagF [Deltaproteobacteria bacterium]|nr:type VI secretion system-associated protein TagF [Deltaproteobacteria bacterium]